LNCISVLLFHEKIARLKTQKSQNRSFAIFAGFLICFADQLIVKMLANQEYKTDWYFIKNITEIDSPALLIYPERVNKNIGTLISMIDDISRIRPHVKTHKSIDATRLLMHAKIRKFKCATIAEAEMLGIAGAKDVLLAYQPAGPKLNRFIQVIKKYPETILSCLIDNALSAKNIALAASENNIIIPVYLDLNVGMNRTGIKPGEKAVELYKQCAVINGFTRL
jgi:D-serine deaminase-like pyridoxal phosphate-dependent protein